MANQFEIKNLKLKIIFMGTPEIAATVLEALLKNGYPISSVVTRPDKPQGRSNEPQQSPAKLLAQKYKIPVFQPKSKLELEEYIKAQKPDLILVTAFGMIITKGTLDVPNLGCLNVHPSLLPKYRGPWPIGAPILAGDDKTGTTIMLMSEGMDEGDILTQKEIELRGDETTPELTEKLANLSSGLLLETLPNFLDGNIEPQKQNDTLATYTKMAKKEDGKIEWSDLTAEEVERMSRAYQPWPGIFTFWNQKKLDLFELSVTKREISAGKVEYQNDQIFIGTKTTAITPKSLKLEGKTKISASDFARGYKDFNGANLN